ncbi:MAG TPA: Lrp/AsnC ligand binding domain-containing protein [Anaerolineales bacterium]|nr:Lrp/AsnC ligand binding domain-containing protein [Anaerolineales bacterium]
MKAYVMIKIRPGDVREVVRRLHETPRVVEANMTFGPYDAVAVIEAESLGALGTLIAASIQPIPGVEQTLTCLAVEL